MPWAGGRGSRRRTRPFREFCNYSSASSILRLLRVLRRAVAPLRPGSAHPLAGERVLPFPGRLCLIGVLHVEQQALAINIFPTFGSLVRLRRFILIFKASLGLEPPPHSLFLSFSSSLFSCFSLLLHVFILSSSFRCFLSQPHFSLRRSLVPVTSARSASRGRFLWPRRTTWPHPARPDGSSWDSLNSNRRLKVSHSG